MNEEVRKVPMINSIQSSSYHDVVLDSIRDQQGIVNIESIQNWCNYDNQSSTEIDLSEFETLSERNMEAVDGNHIYENKTLIIVQRWESIRLKFVGQLWGKT